MRTQETARPRRRLLRPTRRLKSRPDCCQVRETCSGLFRIRHIGMPEFTFGVYACVIVHVARHVRGLVGEEIWARIAAREQEVSANPEMVHTHNGRLPWTDYRAMVLEDLRKATGLHELMLILSLERETGDTAHKWIRRLQVGRSILHTRMGTNLSDAIYVKLAARQLTKLEVTDMARMMMATAAGRKHLNICLTAELSTELY